ncbi:MAG: PilZ domain-containing protein [Spirochaetaceae bacterium]|jgi:hypothetical protein|nr:PilZ domain-containing protein [Spirochaetaceae bacterium]
MIHFYGGAIFFPLQASNGVKYFKDDDPAAALMLLAGAAALIGIIFLVSIARRILRKMGVDFSGFGNSKGFSTFALRRAAWPYRLDPEQFKLLETVFREDSITNPRRVLTNTASLDRHFRSYYQKMKQGADNKDPATAQRVLALLFSTRNAIDTLPPVVSTSAGPPQIPGHSAAVFRAKGKSYPVTVLRAEGVRVTISAPVNALGTPITMPEGSSAVLSCFIDATRGLASGVHVTGTSRNSKGTPVVDLALTGKSEVLIKRKSRRRTLKIACSIQTAAVTPKPAGGGTAVKLDPLIHSGYILDISSGGCSISTRGILKVGKMAKISFDGDTDGVVMLAQILRINRGPQLDAVVHLKFLKVPLKSMNMINALVFGYAG